MAEREKLHGLGPRPENGSCKREVARFYRWAAILIRKDLRLCGRDSCEDLRRVAGLEDELADEMTQPGRALNRQGKALRLCVTIDAGVARDQIRYLSCNRTAAELLIDGAVAPEQPIARGFEGADSEPAQRLICIQIVQLILDNEELDLTMRQADCAIRMRQPQQPDLIQIKGLPKHLFFFVKCWIKIF